MIKFIGLLITLFAGVMGVVHASYDSKKEGGFLKRISLSIPSKIMIALAIVGFLASFVDTVLSNRDTVRKEKMLKDAYESLLGVLSTAENIKTTLADKSSLIIKNTNLLETNTRNVAGQFASINYRYETMVRNYLSSIRYQLELRSGQDIAYHVKFDSSKFWILPRQVMRGSICKFYGFKSRLLLLYSDKINENLLNKLSTTSDFESLNSFVNLTNNEKLITWLADSSLHFNVITPANGIPPEIAILGSTSSMYTLILISLSNESSQGQIAIREERWNQYSDLSYHNYNDSVSTKVQKVGKVIVESQLVIVYDGPGINYRQIGTLKYGQVINVKARNGNWLRITSEVSDRSGRLHRSAATHNEVIDGWILAAYLSWR